MLPDASGLDQRRLRLRQPAREPQHIRQIAKRGGRSQGVGGLLGVPPLDPLVAHGAATNGNVKASPDRLAHNLVLVLRLDLLHLQHAPARTLAGRWHSNHFVDVRGNLFAGALAIGRTGLAPWWSWVGFALASGKGCGLPLDGTQSLFYVSLESLVLLPQSLPFLLQFLLSLPQLLVFFPQSFILGPGSAPLLLQDTNLVL